MRHHLFIVLIFDTIEPVVNISRVFARESTAVLMAWPPDSEEIRQFRVNVSKCAPRVASGVILFPVAADFVLSSPIL